MISPRPRSISFPRTIGEAVLGLLPLVLLAVLVEAVRRGSFAYSVIAAAEWLWLAAWPAWRLRPLRLRFWWQRLPVGLARLAATASILVLLGAAAQIVQELPTQPRLAALHSTVAIGVLSIIFRLLVAFAASISRPVRRRLRWQLMASHAAVIVLTIMALTAAGSVIGLGLGLNGIQPDARAMARSVAEELTIARSLAPFNRALTQQIIERFVSGRLPVAGEPPLSGIIPRYPRPNPILVERPDGRRLTATAGTNKELRQYPDQRPVLDRLRRLALTGQAAVLRPTGTLKGDAIVFAAAPVRGPNGRIVAVVLLQANDIQVTPGRFFQGAVALFGVATVVLVLIASVPLLALSFVFSYFLARGFTRRLEAVSRVATAIAAGNLSERAPVSTRNEVGLLAGDINRMAAHLETTIAELEQARTQAEEALRLRQQLVANVSHELRTPLAVVRAHLDALAMRKPAVGAHRASLQAATGAPLQDAALTVPAAALDAVAAEIGRLESLVEDLFALSRAESDALDVRCEAVDVARIVGEVAGQMRPLVQREGGITLTVEAPPGLPQAQADPERLRQILGNLVRNAVRHTPEGGIIALTVSSESEWIVAGVADTGEGIAPEHLPHIFERFYRTDDARSRERGGAGLGLAIVRELVELMGGRVTVESVPGEGTCFRVYLRRGPNLAAQQ